MPVAACGYCDTRFCVETEADTHDACPLCEHPMSPTTVLEAVQHLTRHVGQPTEDPNMPIAFHHTYRKCFRLIAELSAYQSIVQQACEQSRQLVATIQESRGRRRRGEW